MLTQLNNYLERGLSVMAWVETLYTLAYDGLQAKLEALISRSEDLAKALKGSQPQVRQLLHEINEMMGDISQLDADWNQTLLTTPCEIWGDVTIFAKSRFLVPTKAGTLESLAPTLAMEDRQGTVKPLFSTSRSSLDAKRLAILSVFPCRLVCSLEYAKILLTSPLAIFGMVGKEWRTFRIIQVRRKEGIIVEM
jgi:hypothetical protein